MKQTSFCCWLLVVLFAGHLFSQTIPGRIILHPAITSIAQVNTSDYTYGLYDIGKMFSDPNTYKFRAYWEFDLSDIPDNATIVSVQVTYSTDGSGYSFKLTKLFSISGNLGPD
ncbi:hypothetical protein JW935_00800 [candidate division KSB1 bacterium]|nr:hypothetical protein [candidate division KSB1 bacterium]